MPFSFIGKTVLVTGAGAGIGKAIVEKLLECGAQVIAVSLVQSELDTLVKEHPGIRAIQADLRDWQGTRKALSGIGVVHGLVNNAGVAITAPFLEITEEQFDLTFDVNVKAVINVSQIVAKSMLDNGIKGAIVNISSIAALKALEDHSVYCAAKAAVDGLMRNMAAELGPHGIRTNSINPTVVLTELGRRVWADPLKQQKLLKRLPLGHFAEISDVVDPVLYLLSEHSAMVNGLSMTVDGGFNIA